MGIAVGRPINGIGLNGNEYLLDKEGNTRTFESIKAAKQYLLDTDFPNYTDEELEDNFHFIEESEIV